jgi:hypothetical protein
MERTPAPACTRPLLPPSRANAAEWKAGPAIRTVHPICGEHILEMRPGQDLHLFQGPSNPLTNGFRGSGADFRAHQTDYHQEALGEQLRLLLHGLQCKTSRK